MQDHSWAGLLGFAGAGGWQWSDTNLVPGTAAAKHRALQRREGGGKCSWPAKAGFEKGADLFEGVREFGGGRWN